MGSSDAKLVVGGTGESQINVRGIQFRGGSDIDVAAGATLALNGIVQFDSSDATFDGAGTIRFGGSVHVNEVTTLNCAAVGLDYDGVSVIDINASLTINAGAINDGGDGVDDAITIARNHSSLAGKLVVSQMLRWVATRQTRVTERHLVDSSNVHLDQSYEAPIQWRCVTLSSSMSPYVDSKTHR